MGQQVKEKKVRTIKTKARDIRLTFKEDEEDLQTYLESKSSATCFLKDLARIEMERERRMLESANSNLILEQLKALLDQKTPVINLTAQIGNIQAPAGGYENTDDIGSGFIPQEVEEELDISDIIGDEF